MTTVSQARADLFHGFFWEKNKDDDDVDEEDDDGSDEEVGQKQQKVRTGRKEYPTSRADAEFERTMGKVNSLWFDLFFFWTLLFTEYAICSTLHCANHGLGKFAVTC